MYRDPDLLNLAKGERCLLETSYKCLGDEGTTTVACHSNMGIHGKGKSLKADDCYSVWGCHICHRWLDAGKATQEEKEAAFLIAYEKQIEQWHLIADNPLLRPWKVEAARRVIKHLESLNGSSG
jgi:hypothetical protein